MEQPTVAFCNIENETCARAYRQVFDLMVEDLKNKTRRINTRT